MLELTVPEQTAPVAAKDFLRQSGLSLTLRRKIKHHGTMICNGQPITWNDQLTSGDCLQVTWPAQSALTPQALPLTVIYEDETLLIVDKPAGVMVHPTARKDEVTVANGVLHYYQSTNQPIAFHPVHRLDRQTSGLLLIAKNAHYHNCLLQQGIKNLHRTYLAVVSGCVKEDQGTITSPIARKPGSIIERMISPAGQTAVTEYLVIARTAEATLVQIRLLTGRTHQIRVHFSSLGHPLLGDDLYGGATDIIARQALHAAKLSFLHPIDNRIITVTSPLPADMKQLLTLFGLEGNKTVTQFYG